VVSRLSRKMFSTLSGELAEVLCLEVFVSGLKAYGEVFLRRIEILRIHS
jgi:hypothetical protein